MDNLHAFAERARHDPDIGHAVPMFGVQVGLHLEDEAREFIMGRLQRLLVTQGPRRRPRPQVDELVQKRLDALVAHRAAEVDGRHLSFFEFFVVEGRRQLPNHLAVLLELRVQFLIPNLLADLISIFPGNPLHRRLLASLRPRVEPDLVFRRIIHASKSFTVADRKRAHGRLEVELRRDLVQHLPGRHRRPVQLIHEREDRQIRPPRDAKQLPRLRLQALASIDKHDRVVRRAQRPVRVLGEVRVARRVHQVDARAAILES